MNVLIDASNIVSDSGGFIHLKELLKNHETKNKNIIGCCVLVQCY